jgi:cyanate permease
MCIASVGQNGTNPWFWTLSSTQMTDTAAAAGIAAINSVGNLGSFMGPHVVGWIKDTTQSFDGVGDTRAARPLGLRSASNRSLEAFPSGGERL